ncbi:MAG: hypothetical protein KDJ22_13435 [Candidatus Competibacteraceae bacterium]|nr:hypothetical protein [Candidatus Competibacteraceae bacterium]MCP5127864.1 hypothetical protein [Gammaproteobacteria bacterium]HRX69725.1 hypothetical protein [Candidatus Competibacteraceae bacterium]
MTDRLTDWHWLFGLTLTDLFQDTPWRVELERNLALQKQQLDVAIIEQCASGGAGELPDGLENFRRHNLLTYKSQREAMDGWAFDELLGHFVNYRKQLEDDEGNLPDVGQFQLYAVATRHPRALSQGQHLRKTAWPGVSDVVWGTQTVRLIVLNRIAPHPRNAFWELFSSRQERIRHGVRHYRPRRAGAWELLYQLYLTHLLEDPRMAQTLAEFAEEIHRRFLDSIPLEAWLRGLPPEERLRGLSPEERLRGLSPEELQQLEAYLKTRH